MYVRAYCVCFSASIGLTNDQKAIQEMALSFAKNEISPNMSEWDEKVETNFIGVVIIITNCYLFTGNVP